MVRVLLQRPQRRRRAEASHPLGTGRLMTPETMTPGFVALVDGVEVGADLSPGAERVCIAFDRSVCGAAQWGNRDV